MLLVDRSYGQGLTGENRNAGGSGNIDSRGNQIWNEAESAFDSPSARVGAGVVRPITAATDSRRYSPDLEGERHTMEISDELLCLYSGRVTKQDDSYVIEVPESEIANGAVEQERVYSVALFSNGSTEGGKDDAVQNPEQPTSGPPVSEGDQRTVDIEDIGEQGDGIARVERGYVVIVPNTEQGERVTIEITNVRENLGFAEVVEREDYYE